MMCGIEIHQRIAGKKLFCNCVPSSESAAATVQFNRRLHAVLSELGELDSAVRIESIRQRLMRYSAPLSSSCLVEADEEPPHHLNHEALSAVILFCNLLSSRVVDEVHIMRKNVIDGSNTSGFQRTAVIGMGGAITTPVGELGIQAVCIEEESAGILEAGKEAHADYELSRLSIPLVEIATEPTLKSGKEAQEAALAIGQLLRQTGLVSRGIGTIRQDLNVSIPEGARVEVKGVQELGMIAATVDLEVRRQEKLLALVEQIKGRLKGAAIDATFVDLTEIFAETRSQLVAKQIRTGAKVLGMRLPSHEGLLGVEIQPNRRYGSELADYARAAGIRGLIHSDEDLAKYGFSEDEIFEATSALSIKKGDAFVLVVGDQKKADAALCEVACRANFLGVPEETRKASPDGTSSYMRPLPGRARMYPETDVPTIPITKELLDEAKDMAKAAAVAQEEKAELLSSLPEELAKQLSAAKGLLGGEGAAGQSPEIAAFSSAVNAGIEAKFASSVITNTLQSLKREGVETKNLDGQKFLSALLLFKENKITKAAVPEILREMCRDSKATAESAAKKLNIERISGKALGALLEKEKLDMKALMTRYRLQVDAQEAQGLMNKNGKQ
ncbi:MAG: Glu-tRNA(Gln) amidotransferase subunit GatE [Candidatus Micrarchaeota archaeon]|nr:Glu-tRNA(Gln) amidotransferase subunit GatE [Candidatus Micrarchaeota archaeon]